jgi:outer membrane receptor protein involved in Fe transport
MMLITPAAHAQSQDPAPAAEAAPAPEQPPAQAAPADLPVIPVQDTAAAPSAPARPTEAAPAKLDDVIVTSTKRAQASRDIPSSMAVMEGEKIEELGLRKLKDIFTLVPGVNMQDEIAGLQRKVSVRGVGPDNGTNQTVGSVMGDIPISDPYGATTIVDPNPWDMNTVEVLKGPQGTLFGATSLAGLIRYVPNYPELDHWGAKGFVDYTKVTLGSAAPSYGAAFNVPIGQSIALRAAGIRQGTPGVFDSDNPAREEKDTDKGRSWDGRVMALWQPTDRFTVNAWYDKDHRHADDLSIVTFADGSYVRKDAPAPSPVDNGYSLGTLDARYAFDWATLVSLSGYQQKASHTLVETSYLVQPLAQAGVSFARTRRDVSTHGIVEELRLVSPDDDRKLSWLGGVYYGTYVADILAQLYVPNTDQLSQYASIVPLPVLSGLFSAQGLTATQTGYHPLKASERALYGEANYDFTKRWRLTLGSRLYRTSVNGVLQSSGASSANNGATPGTTEKGWSPKVALTYRPWTDVMFYGTVSRGFQFGGFNLPTVPDPNVPLRFKSSALWNYEAGVRTDWFQRTLRADVTEFFLDWKDPQVSQVEPDGANVYVSNVGGTHNLGSEATLRWLTPLDGLSLEEAASYIEARTSKPFTDASGAAVPVGTLMPSSPRVQSVTTLTYTHPFGAWMTQTALISSRQGKSWAEITHVTETGNFTLLTFNFSITRSDLPGAPALTLTGNNLLNVQKVVNGFGPPPGTPAQVSTVEANSTYAYTQPRSFVVRLSAGF